MNSRLAACCLAVAVILFAKADIAPAEELSKTLPKVESSLGSSESVLARINVNELSIQYREGKYIENTRDRAFKYAQRGRDAVARVARVDNETRLYDLLTLLTMLRGLDSQIETLIWQLDRPITIGDSSRTKASEWATALNKSADSLAGAIAPFEDEVFRWVQSVDKRLVNCP